MLLRLPDFIAAASVDVVVVLLRRNLHANQLK